MITGQASLRHLVDVRTSVDFSELQDYFSELIDCIREVYDSNVQASSENDQLRKDLAKLSEENNKLLHDAKVFKNEARASLFHSSWLFNRAVRDSSMPQPAAHFRGWYFACRCCRDWAPRRISTKFSLS